ncbi:MAG TPA: hypothetical protein VNJ08_00500 [Bacteriovoracaceae bacterium]|nr:hypothetical protein [Bacteriovoracaceae bacterium]
MIKFLSISLLLLSLSCSLFKKKSEGPLEITEIHPNQMTAMTKKHLIKISKTHNLTPFLYTKEIRIESYVTPRSHPVLTLNTSAANSPDKILATFLHEQFHWWVLLHREKTQKAVDELREKFPTIPGSDEIIDDRTTYLHLAICWLEYKAIKKYLGEERAAKVIEDAIKVEKIYPRIYSLMMKRSKDIELILKKYSLIPKQL